MFGAGRAAALLLNLMEWMGLPWSSVSFYDDSYPDKKVGARNLPILGIIEEGLHACAKQRIPSMVAMGHRYSAERYATFLKALDLDIPLANLIHPSAMIHPNVKIGTNVAMNVGSVVCAGATIGSLCNLAGARVVIEHDNKISDNVVFGAGIALSGLTEIGSHSFIGSGVSSRHEVQIGERCLIGAGAVVVSNIPSGMVAVGNPARVLRPVQQGDDAPTEEQLRKALGRVRSAS